MRIDGIRHSDIYIIGEKKLESKHHILEHDTGRGLIFVTNTNVEGIFRYGFHDYTENYTWSSRAGVMNKTFDIALVEVFYKEEGAYSYTTCAMDVAHLEQLLEETDYEINWTPQEDNTDVVYKLKKRNKS